MRKLLLFALAFCSASAHALAQSPPAPAAPPGGTPKVTVTAGRQGPAPLQVIPDEIFDAELQDLDDGSFSLSQYRGRVFVLNFWATWCGPCRLEIPHLNKLYEEYSARGVEFVGLTTERPGADSAKVRQFAREFRMTYKLGWADPDLALALMNGKAIPQTLVVGADGRVVLRMRGYSPDKSPQMLRDAVEKALNAPPEADPAATAPGVQTSPATPAPSKPAAPTGPARP